MEKERIQKASKIRTVLQKNIGVHIMTKMRILNSLIVLKNEKVGPFRIV